MSTEIHQQTKEITKNFHEQRRLVEEMTLLQTQAIDQILTQIRDELNPEAAAERGGLTPSGGRHRTAGGNHPQDEGKVAQRGRQDAASARSAHPPDSPEGSHHLSGTGWPGAGAPEEQPEEEG